MRSVEMKNVSLGVFYNETKTVKKFR